jgi:hypothetical protein
VSAKQMFPGQMPFGEQMPSGPQGQMRRPFCRPVGETREAIMGRWAG